MYCVIKTNTTFLRFPVLLATVYHCNRNRPGFPAPGLAILSCPGPDKLNFFPVPVNFSFLIPVPVNLGFLVPVPVNQLSLPGFLSGFLPRFFTLILCEFHFLNSLRH